MGTTGTADGGRARARPGRGLKLPSLNLHKVYETAGSSQALSRPGRDPQSTQAIVGPLAGLGVLRGHSLYKMSSLLLHFGGLGYSSATDCGAEYGRWSAVAPATSSGSFFGLG